MKKKSTLFLLFIFLFGCEANSNISNKSTLKENPNICSQMLMLL